MKSHAVRIAVIGVGYFGHLHAKKLASLEGAELAAVVDIDVGRATQVAAGLGVRAAASHLEVMDDIDAAVVAASSSAHVSIARDLLAAGKDVLCEKPMALSGTDAAALVDLAGEKRRVLQVGHIERFNPAAAELLRRVQTPCFVEAHRISPIKKRALDMDVVLDVMIHDIDIVFALTGETPVEIQAVGASVIGRHPDIVNARLAFPGGCVANLTASRLALKEERKMRVFQPDSYLTLDFTKPELLAINQVTFKEGGQPDVKFERPQLNGVDQLEAELQSFVECVRDRGAPLVDGVQALAVTECALHIRDTVKAGLAKRMDLTVRPAAWVGLER